MSLNWKEIDAVLAEIDPVDMHVERIVQPDFRNLYLSLYHPKRRSTIRICLAHPFVRLHGVSRPRRLKRSHQRFESFLAARIRSGRITRCEQLESDRVVLMEIHRMGETTRLYARLWGPHANIIATDDHDVILDAFYRKPQQGIASGLQFEPPTPGTVPPEKTIRPREPNRSLNDQIEHEYEQQEQERERQRLVKQLSRLLTRRRGQLLSRREQLSRASDTSEVQQLRHYADLILSNLHAIPSGVAHVEVPDFENDGRPVVLQLDPTISPQQNAEQLYSRAKRAVEQSDMITQNLKQVHRNLVRVEEELDSVESLSLSDLRHRVSEIEADQRSRKREPETGTVGLEFASGGFRILVGRNANENDELLRRYVRGNDYWLHTRDFPGGYVFVKSKPGKSIPLDVLLDAGNLAVFFSKARSNAKADLYYTQVKHLRRAKDGPKGLVLPTQEKNLFVELDTVRLGRIGIGDQTI